MFCNIFLVWPEIAADVRGQEIASAPEPRSWTVSLRHAHHVGSARCGRGGVQTRLRAWRSGLGECARGEGLGRSEARRRMRPLCNRVDSRPVRGGGRSAPLRIDVIGTLRDGTSRSGAKRVRGTPRHLPAGLRSMSASYAGHRFAWTLAPGRRRTLEDLSHALGSATHVNGRAR